MVDNALLIHQIGFSACSTLKERPLQAERRFARGQAVADKNGVKRPGRFHATNPLRIG